MYQLFIEKQVQKHLEKIPEPDYSRIKKAILNLSNDPRPRGYKKLKGRNGYRIRQGHYRIIYEIDDNKLIVYVLLAGHRGDIYE